MSISELVGEKLGISEPSARFLVALYSAYPLSFLYRLLVAEQSPIVKNTYLSLSGIAVVYYIIGTGIWHSLVDVLAVYAVLCVCGGTLFSVVATWIIMMGHMTYGYTVAAMSGEIHQISWRIPHCVLVLKLIGLAYNLYDARKKESELSEDMKNTAIADPPSLLEMTGFSYFHGSVLAGPQIVMEYKSEVPDCKAFVALLLIPFLPCSLGLLSFRRYQNFVNGVLFDWDNTPGSVPAALQRLLGGVVLSVVYSVLNMWFPLSTVLSQEFNDHSFPIKLFLMVVCGKVALWRYVTVWLIAEGSCILIGMSYNGVSKEGAVDWHGLANIHMLETETSITLQGIIDSFNINTNKWVALYVFKRLKWLRSKVLSFLITLSFISLWHGVWPGYALCFSLEFISILAERSFISVMKQVLGGSLSELSLVMRVPLTVLAYILRHVLLFYPLTLFMLLSWESCYKFMSSVYFITHVLLVTWLLLYHLVIANVLPRKRRLKTE